MQNSTKINFLVTFIILLCTPLMAIIIRYDAVLNSGNSWEYEYTIFNNDTFDIESLSISFDSSNFSDLALASSDGISSKWDEQFFNYTQDTTIYDSLAIGTNKISSGETISGFSVSFTYSGIGSPGSQFFEIFDPEDYSEPLTSGWTIPVPEPATLLLVTAGLVVLRKNKH